MSQLLDGKLVPITYEIGFIECDLATAVQGYLNWMREIYDKRGRPMTEKDARGTLQQILTQLLPLTSVDTVRFLFVPTSSSWTAFFDNGHRGTDATPPMRYLARTLGCRAVRVCYVPDDVPNRYPSRMLELYGPEVRDNTNTVRALAVGYDGSEWTYVSFGEIQPFEQLTYYAEDRKEDRFPYILLDRYLRKLGIRAFEEDFYLPNSATLIQKEGPVNPRTKEFGLDNEVT